MGMGEDGGKAGAGLENKVAFIRRLVGSACNLVI